VARRLTVGLFSLHSGLALREQFKNPARVDGLSSGAGYGAA